MEPCGVPIVERAESPVLVHCNSVYPPDEHVPIDGVPDTVQIVVPPVHGTSQSVH